MLINKIGLHCYAPSKVIKANGNCLFSCLVVHKYPEISEDESNQKTDTLREESIREILQHLEVMSEDKIVLAHNLLKDKNYENEDEIGVDAKREILFNELAKYMKNQDYAGAMGDIWPYIRNKIYCWCNLLMKIKSVPYMVKLVKIHALVSMHEALTNKFKR